jgi:hypothetical protein
MKKAVAEYAARVQETKENNNFDAIRDEFKAKFLLEKATPVAAEKPEGEASNKPADRKDSDKKDGPKKDDKPADNPKEASKSEEATPNDKPAKQESAS